MRNVTKKIAATVLVAALVASLDAAAGETNDSSQGVVNINTASSAELEYLPGVGPATAKKIVTHRENRRFKRPREIIRVRGVGRKTFAKMRPFLTVDGPTTAKNKIRSPK
ncbi:MAG: helix-hairpin-helix domain-containing protein [Polyangia bacterium]